MRLRIVRRQLNSLLPCRFGAATLTRLRVQIRQVKIGSVGIIAPVKNTVQFGCFAQSYNVARVTLECVLVLVKSLLPLLGLHIAKPQPAPCHGIIWELR